MTAALAVACALVAVAVAVWSARRYRWPQRTILRLRWASTARSCGLERRGVPTLSHGRLVGDVGVKYRLRPSHGGTIGDIAEAAEQLAAALRLRRVEIIRLAPHRGELVALWP